MDENGKSAYTERELASIRKNGLAAVEDMLNYLHTIGAIDGFAYVLDNVGRDTYEAAGCCAAHMADMVDPEILMDSPHPVVRAALAARMQRDISRIQNRSEEAPESMLSALQSLGFRTYLVDENGASEVTQKPSTNETRWDDGQYL